MALILSIDTATEICSAALFDGFNLISEQSDETGNAHASRLHVLIENLVRETGISLKNLDALSISIGPGSYTGLRVGVSTVKGIAYALKKPVIGINSLEGLANQVKLHYSNQDIRFIVPMIDARRMEVYSLTEDLLGKESRETRPVIVDQDSYAEVLNKGKTVFAGNGCEKCKPVIQHPSATFRPDIICRASGIGPLAYERFLQSDFLDLAYFEPFYLKNFTGVTTPKRLL